MTLYNIYKTDSAILTDTIYKQKVPVGLVNRDTFWVNNNGTWVEFDHFDYFKIKKIQNQVNEFEVQIFDISTAQKLYFKEQSEVLFFCGTTMVLKGRIQTIEYGDAYEVIARGFGMESKLLDQELIVSNDNRVQYDNTSAKSIITEINSGILTTASSGIFATDYGLVSLRFEYANRLNALGKTCEAIDYNWWVSQTSTDGYNTNYLNVNATQGSTASVKTFSMTSNATAISQERDINNLVNYVHALGMGDGINQLATSVYAASTQSSFLNANIESTNSTITCSSIVPFNNTGSVRIAEEIIDYAGKVTASATLTGCTRFGNAKAHYKNCYIEQYYPTDSAQTGSSIQVYGLMDHTFIDKTIINEELLEVIASGYLSDRKNPIVSISITSDEPLTDATLNIGDIVTVTASESNVDGTYHIVKQEYNSNYGVLDMATEVSNRSLEFIEQMNKAREDAETMGKYMQGATNIYAISETENLDSTHPLDLTFYVPTEAIAINSVKLNFRQKGWRSYGDYSINEEELNNPNTLVSIGAIDNETYKNVSASGTPTSVTTSTLIDTKSSWSANVYQNFVMKCENQLRMIDSNSATVCYLHLPWENIPSTNSQYQIIQSYTSNQTDLDITNEIDSIGRGQWANIKFENAGGMNSYDTPDSSLDADLWNYTTSATSSRVTASSLSEFATYIGGSLGINTGSTGSTASFNIAVSTSSLPTLAEMAEINFRIQRGAQIPQNDDDGALSFLTGSKSYGTMTEGVDYNVSGNTLFLFSDRDYHFSSMNVGNGTTVKLDTSCDSGSVLYIACTGTATIAGTFNINGANNSFEAGNQAKTTHNGIIGPGVANGGNAGNGGNAVTTGGTGNGANGGSQGNGFGGGGGAGGLSFYNASMSYGYAIVGANGGNGGTNPSGGGGGSQIITSGGGGTSGGNAGIQSAGGGGGAGGIGDVGAYGTVFGGNGGNTFGGSGTNCGWSGIGGSHAIAGGGGGGCGGLAGKQGCHFYLYANAITFTGTINTSGGNAGNGGNGGNGNGQVSDGGDGFAGGGGGGGAGGGGGGAGNIKFYYVSSISDTGVKTMTGGSAGSFGTYGSGQASAGSSANPGSNGNNGSTGSAGSASNEVQSSTGLSATSPLMYIFGESYYVMDDDSEWKLLKQPNSDWILYNDNAPYDTFSAANNTIGVGITGNYTGTTAINYDWKLYDITLGGRARMRIEANAYIQTFLESK